MIENILVPKHELLDEEEAKEVLTKYKIVKEQLPKIYFDDPAVAEIKPKVGDIIKITRESEFIGKSIYYRVVIE